MASPKKPLNRAFALTFATMIVVWMAWQMVRAYGGGQIPAGIHPAIMVPLIYATFMVGYPVIVLGLLLEVRRPSLDFKLDRNKCWLAAGAFLLGIFVGALTEANYLKILFMSSRSKSKTPGSFTRSPKLLANMA